jgi:hypothetical protein
MVDPALEANDFSPDVVVTLENVTGRVSTPQQALDAEVAGIVEMLATSIDTRTPGTICGYPSTTITDTIYNNYAATGLIIADQRQQKSNLGRHSGHENDSGTRPVGQVHWEVEPR